MVGGLLIAAGSAVDAGGLEDRAFGDENVVDLQPTTGVTGPEVQGPAVLFVSVQRLVGILQS